jgi:hypothetical protein
MSLDLRPLSLGELLDRSFALYRRHFRTVVAIMVPPSVLAMIVGVVQHLMQQFITGADLRADAATVFPVVFAWAVSMVAGMLVYLVAYMFALGATTLAVSELYLGRPATASASYRAMRPRIGSLLLLLLLLLVRFGGVILVAAVVMAVVAGALAVISPVLSGLGVVIGIVLTIVLMMFLTLRYSLAVPALVLEGVTASTAIARSVSLIQGNVLRCLVLMIFAYMIALVTGAIFQGPFQAAAYMAGPETATAFWLTLAGVFTGSIAGAISGPVMIVAFALLYYDIRIREEGLDLQLMMAALEPVPGASSGPIGSSVVSG